MWKGKHIRKKVCKDVAHAVTLESGLYTCKESINQTTSRSVVRTRRGGRSLLRRMWCSLRFADEKYWAVHVYELEETGPNYLPVPPMKVWLPNITCFGDNTKYCIRGGGLRDL